MAPSTSPNPPSALGECVVCGKESTTRCSSCAKGGVEWMYFCSTEHQKLMWTAHKRVCGGSFSYPALKSRERDEMIEMSAQPVFAGSGDEFISWLESLKMARGGTLNQKVSDADKESFKAATVALEDPRQSSVPNQSPLLEHRSMNFKAKMASDLLRGKFSYTDLTRLMAKDPLGFLAFHDIRNFENMDRSSQNPWYSEFQHRMLLFIGILVVVTSPNLTTQSIEMERYTHYTLHALSQLTKFARDRVQPVQPQEANRIVKVYLPRLLKEIGVTLTELGGAGREWDKISESVKLVPGGVVFRNDFDEELRIFDN